MSQTSSTFRKPVRSRSEMVSSKGYVKKLKTKRPKPKPAWDETVTDLTVYKPSPQELRRNHEIHQPKKDHERLLRKMESAQAYLDDTVGSTLFNHEFESPAHFLKKRAFAKEAYYHQKREISSLLSETEKTISQVDDLFGDNVFKYRSVPVMTEAPRFNKDLTVNDVSVLNPHIPDIDCESSSESSSDEDSDENYEHEETEVDNDNDKGIERENRSVFEGKVNLERYQNLLCEESKKLETFSNDSTIPDVVKSMIMEGDGIDGNSGPQDNQLQQQKSKTKKKMKKEIMVKKSEQKPTGSALQTFDEMKKMLETLEKEIEGYEEQTGRVNVSKKIEVPSFVSGYTANLLSIIIRLTHHLKESEVQLKAEMSIRKEIVDMYDDQKKVMDVLTSNVMDLQKANIDLRQDLQNQAKSSEARYMELKKEFDDLEARFNVTFFNSGGSEKLFARKPFGDVTHALNLPVWTDRLDQ